MEPVSPGAAALRAVALRAHGARQSRPLPSIEGQAVPTPKPTVGFIGLGIMGRPMALNLIKAHYRLAVYARRPESAAPLADAGAEVHDSPASLSQHSDIAFTMVADTPDVEEVIVGPRGILHGARRGNIVIDMSTISPEVTRRLADQLAACGIDMLDAPVSGGEQGAVAGTLSIMVGGKADVFARARPLLECLGKNIVHVGDHGAGQVAKACNQILVAQTIAAVAEALLLARAAGADPARVREALLGGFAYSKILEVHGQRMLNHDYKPGFKAKLHQKDIHIALSTAEQYGATLPGAERAARYLDQLVGQGYAELDSAAIAMIVERPAAGD
jgi:2-hydroxy-3-oxopropionate reductase